MALEARWLGARAVQRVDVDDVSVFVEAAQGADAFQRRTPGGLEDDVLWRSPPERAEQRYAIDLVAAAGLRLVSGVLEVLDAGGVPRLRVGPVQAIARDGRALPARLGLEGCAYDSDARAPWGRAVTAPGGAQCEVIVSWSAERADYPVLVDPPWSDTAAMVEFRSDFAAVKLGDGRVLAVGGGPAAAELYDPVTRTWAATGSLPSPASGLAAAPTANDGVLVVGGYVAGSGATASAYLYSPATGVFTAAGGLAHARNGHTATALPAGQVLVVGGVDPAIVGEASDQLAAELFDPASATFSLAGQLGQGRTNHSATALASGDVLVMGGRSNSLPNYPNTLERWSKTTRTFTLAAATPTGFHGADHTATLLPSGSVLFIGGRTTVLSPSGAVDRYDPATDAWTSLASLAGVSTSRTQHGALLLPGGRVAVVGGITYPPVPAVERALELYDPATDGWARGSGDLRLARQDPTVTLLDGGNVLVAGNGTAEVLCLGLGCPCSAQTECLSGLCRDGVCCDADCSGTCQACSAVLKGAGSDGACEPIQAGHDPGDECTATDPSTCQLDGACDGQGGCRKHVSGTPCGAPSCNNPQQESKADACDGAGVCVEQGVQDCGAYRCLGAGCLTACTTVAECSDGYSCVGGRCRKRPNGASCALGAECESGHCVDGSCCNSDCAGQCESCDTAGECRPVSGAAPPGKVPCSGSGTCAARCDGNDPSACAAPGHEVSCGVGMSCENLECVQTTDVCSADRASSVSVAGASESCAPFLCELSSGRCATSCVATAECARGRVCSGSRCVADSADSGDEGGCSVAPPRRGAPGSVVAAVIASALWLRRRRRGLALATSLALVGCGASDPQPAPRAEPELAVARQALVGVPWIKSAATKTSTDTTTVTSLGGGRALLTAAGTAETFLNNLITEVDPLGTPRPGAVAVRLASGHVLLIGGGTATTEEFDPSTGHWTPRATMATSRTGARAARLADGSVLVMGGGASAAERYTPSADRWDPAGDIGTRDAFTATLLASGDVLVAGGSGLATTLVYSAAGNAWTPGPTLTVAREYHAAALLADGRVLIAGGEDVPNAPGGTNSAEIVTIGGASQATAPLPAVYRAPLALAIGEGHAVFVIAGRPGLSSTAVFDLATATWAEGPSLYYARWHLAGDLLDDGRVLVNGGESSPHIPPYYAESTCADYGCACTATADCAVGTCVDGVCCNTPCTGACQACSTALKQGGRNGYCEAVPDGADPDDECAALGPETCGTTGTCDGAGACHLHPANTECAAAQCVDVRTRLPAALCDGSGTCGTVAQVSCALGSYCAAGSCAAGCQATSDCLSGFECRGGVCSKRADGETCTAPGECASNFCADGRCCESSCSGQCESCAESGREGLCVAVTGAPRGSRAACEGSGPCAGSCQGARNACGYPGSDVSCGPGSTCANGACTQTAAFCAGASESQPVTGAPVDCAPFGCDPGLGTCRSGCSSTSDCALGRVCASAVCVDPAAGTGGAGGGGAAAGGDDGGCGCRAVGSTGRRSSGGLVLAALCGVARRRRRRS